MNITWEKEKHKIICIKYLWTKQQMTSKNYFWSCYKKVTAYAKLQLE